MKYYVGKCDYIDERLRDIIIKRQGRQILINIIM